MEVLSEAKSPGRTYSEAALAYFLSRPNVKILAVKKDAKSEAVNPVGTDEKRDYEAAWSGRYPTARHHIESPGRIR